MILLAATLVLALAFLSVAFLTASVLLSGRRLLAIASALVFSVSLLSSPAECGCRGQP